MPANKTQSMSFMQQKDAADLRAMHRAMRLNTQFEAQEKVGKYMLPLSNNIPEKFAMKTQLLPHTQIRTQDFMLKSLKDHEPTVTANVHPLKYTGETIGIPVYRMGSNASIDDINLACAAYLVPFLNTKNSYPFEAYIVATASLFATLDQNLSHGFLNECLADRDIEVLFLETTDRNVYWASFFNYCDTDWGDCAFDLAYRTQGTRALLAFVGVCLQTFGKQVNDQNAENWFNKRLNALSSVLTVENLESFNDLRPTVSALQKAYGAMSTAFYLRRAFVDRMFKFKHIKSQVGIMMGHVLQMLAGTDITHVITIDTYLIKSVPEVLNLPILRQYETNLLAMYEFWDENEDIFPYVRLYLPQEECTAIHRENLGPLIAAAFAIGSYMSDSFRNYKGPVKESSLFKAVYAEVKKYLDTRMSLAPIALSGSDRATMTDMEREQMFLKINTANPSDVYLASIRDMEALKEMAEKGEM